MSENIKNYQRANCERYVELAERMEAEAEQFSECSRINDRRANTSAAEVADLARVVLLRFSAEVRQANNQVQSNGADEPRR